MTKMQERLEQVQNRIQRVCARVGRNADDITILAVSKTKPAEQVISAYEAGLRNFGENRFQECPEKIRQVEEVLGEEKQDIHWHFIGHLQSNKVRKVLEYFPMIQSLDSEKILRRVNHVAGEMDITVDGLLQVNVSGSVTQYGFPPHLMSAALETVAKCENLKIRGLMAIGPHDESEYLIRRAFERVRLEAERIESKHIPNVEMSILSMGMSGDFEMAIEEGSTMIRVGTVLFGPR